MTFMAWPEIESFHNVRKFIRVDPGEWWKKKELLSGNSTVTYRCKIKLHGTNAAVQCLADGSIVAQSRTSIITPENDNAGFARWVKNNEAAWKDTRNGARAEVIVYGEWCGPGIQKGVAVSQIPKKCFAVFAARPLGGPVASVPVEDIIWTDPEVLEEIVQGIPDTYVLPWYARGSELATLQVNWNKSDEELSQIIAPINDWVLDVEKNDPWVSSTFGVNGTGEGLVFYPVSPGHISFESFNNLCFKAKGEAHKNIKTAAPAQVNPEAAANVEAFVELVLTSARLEQGALFVGGFDLKLTGKFVNWIASDIQKECQDEMSASSLEWKLLQKPIADKTRLWFIEQCKK